MLWLPWVAGLGVHGGIEHGDSLSLICVRILEIRPRMIHDIYIYICSPPPRGDPWRVFLPDFSFSYCKLFPITIHFFFLPFFFEEISTVPNKKLFTIIHFCLNQIPTWLQPFVLELGWRKCKFKYHLCRWRLLQRINQFFHQRRSCVLRTVVFMHRSSCKSGKKSSLNSVLSLFQSRLYLQ